MGAVATLVVVLAACSKSGGDTHLGSATSLTATTTSTVATTSSTAPTTTTIPQTPQATPQAAADGFLNAWRAQNRAAALAFADEAAVDVVFQIPPETGQSRGCNSSGVDPSYCVYRLTVGELQLRIGKRGAGWIVVGAILGS